MKNFSITKSPKVVSRNAFKVLENLHQYLYEHLQAYFTIDISVYAFPLLILLLPGADFKNKFQGSIARFAITEIMYPNWMFKVM